MNNKELILKRLLENKHITIEEMFILNESKVITNEKVIIKEIKAFDSMPWIKPNEINPYWYSTITCNPSLLKDTLSSDYKMD